MKTFDFFGAYDNGRDTKKMYENHDLEEIQHLTKTNDALFDLCDALSDALVEMCMTYPNLKISRSHDRRIKDATTKLKELM